MFFIISQNVIIKRRHHCFPATCSTAPYISCNWIMNHLVHSYSQDPRCRQYFAQNAELHFLFCYNVAHVCVYHVCMIYTPKSKANSKTTSPRSHPWFHLNPNECSWTSLWLDSSWLEQTTIHQNLENRNAIKQKTMEYINIILYI